MRYVMSLVIVIGISIGISALLNIDTDDESSRFVGSDRWVEFSVEPTVCGGRLEVSGQTTNGARFGGASADFSPFVLYESSGFSYGRGGTIPPVLGFLEPLGPNEFYPTLEPGDQIAARLEASPATGRFTLESELPNWVAEEPTKYTFGIWGYRRPGEPSEILRSFTLQTC